MKCEPQHKLWAVWFTVSIWFGFKLEDLDCYLFTCRIYSGKEGF